ncbi:MAG: Crp/Fnr family transcriptional regulator [Oleispira sp.]|nr:Crp/Fnr family transcriptional regulator [Oleispira sp.]MBL4881136.1 Crp/Fnr family transcriptional regulator [Oleispira sp.]
MATSSNNQFAQEQLAKDKLQMQKICEQQLAITLSNWESFTQHFSARELETQQHWIQAGDTCTELCFILEGLIRIYYIDQGGNEVNQHFYQANEVIAPVDALVSKEPCQYFVQALEPTRLMIANYNELSKAGEDNPELLRLEIKMLQTIFIKSARREAHLLLGNAEQRYRWFCKEYTELSERLPQYHIASFLGITPVSLSRLRKSIADR